MVDLKLFDGRVDTVLYPDSGEVAEALTERIIGASKEAISRRNAFHLVLAGGTTPQYAYQLLRRAITDWRCWHIYYGDERCLPIDDPQRNSAMAQRAWLDHVAIPQQQIHPIAAELGAEAGAAAYSVVIEKISLFDMVLLGMGEDGHIASLFPGHRHDGAELVYAVHNAPKLPADRISLSASSLCRTRTILITVTGESKRAAIGRWAMGEELPISMIERDSKNEIIILLDRSVVGNVD